MLRNIEFNPYRILGVYSNSSKKEQISNKGKMLAFLKVGKNLTSPLDLPNILPPINRTEEMVEDAISRLALEKEQIQYAQFWFINKTNIDEVAFNHLLAGNYEEADNIWSKGKTISSLQNRITLNLILNNWKQVFLFAEELYENHADNFISTFDDSIALKLSKDQLIHQFLDNICSDVSLDIILSHINNSSWKDYLINNEINPIVDQLVSLVEKAKSVDQDNPFERLNAGTSLLNNSKPLLAKLKSLVPDETDMKYQVIADKVGLEILRCGIDYYNNVEHNSNTANSAMTLQKEALSMVVGTMAKEKCQTNIDILEKNIESLPPSEVAEEEESINNLIAEFCSKTVDIEDSIKLLENARPYLKSIKSKLGSKNSYYLNISTHVVSNALYVIIAIINDCQGIEDHGIYKTYNIDRSLLAANLTLAQKAYRIMRKYDLEKEYKKFFKKNMKTLDYLSEKLNVNTYAQHIGCYVIVGIIIICAFIGGIVRASDGDSFFEGFAMWAFISSLGGLFILGIMHSD